MEKKQFSVSVIIPARDEEGTIQNLVDRIPAMGKITELIFVEGFSNDNTWSEIQQIIKKSKKKNIVIKAYKQSEKGKKQALEVGFTHATGDILMILDSDLSVAPEILTKFYYPLQNGTAEFVNGSRFIFPQEKNAMRFLNTLGNKAFATIFTLLLGQKVTDTLCGTKVFFRKDWKKIQEVTKTFSSQDPFGDFQLFLGADLLGLRIKEIPVKYYARVYGQTKISRFRDGIKLIYLVLLFCWEVLFKKAR